MIGYIYIYIYINFLKNISKKYFKFKFKILELQFSDVELMAIIPNKIMHQMAKKIVESFLKGRILVKIKFKKKKIL
jgi:hypothetical protein